MTERLTSIDLWKDLREKTDISGNGKGRCLRWCRIVSEMDQDIARTFKIKKAELGDIQIDQYATSLLVHYWLERSDGFIADGTAGQFEPSFEDGYYGLLGDAPENLKEIYLSGRIFTKTNSS